MSAVYVDGCLPRESRGGKGHAAPRLAPLYCEQRGLRPSQHPLVETAIVPDGPDVADM